MRTLDEVIATFGPPAFDWPHAFVTHQPESGEKPAEVHTYRGLRYVNLSEMADADFIDYGPSRGVRMRLLSKYIGPKEGPRAQTSDAAGGLTEGRALTDLRPGEEVVASGTWLYGNEVPCAVRIVRTTFRPGSGDEEDTPELRDDATGIWFRVDFAVAGEATGFAGGSYFRDVESAKRGAEAQLPGPVTWKPPA